MPHTDRGEGPDPELSEEIDRDLQSIRCSLDLISHPGGQRLDWPHWQRLSI